MRLGSWWLIGSATVAAAAVGTAVWLLEFRTDTKVTPIGVDEALALVVGSVTPSNSEPDATVVPAIGVYTYATTGREEVDALGGASHDYPATTVMVVSPASCGVVQRWMPVAERYDDFGSCPTPTADGFPGVLMDTYVELHQFFGFNNLEAYTCVGEPRPIGAAAGATWTVTCTRDKETGHWTGEVIGAETMEVAGTEVDVEHVVVTVDNGDPNDSQRHETWYLAGTDLVVRRVTDVTTVEPSPIGEAHYNEHYEIVLASLEPVTLAIPGADSVPAST